MFRKLILFVFCMICPIFTSCNSSNQVAARQALAFDTVITIHIYDSPRGEELLDQCLELCTTYENLFSRTREGSDIYRINHSGGKPVEVHPETADLIQTALSYSQLSDGAFDITLAPVSDLWDFGGSEKRIPSDTEIQECLLHTGYEKIGISNQQVQLSDPLTQLDLGGIAKGYVADQLKIFLQKNGVKHALINLGGNVLAFGGKPDGSPFHIAIQKPFDAQGSAITSVQTKQSSVVSSGNYQRYFEKDGVLYHHILDPKTGYPCRNTLNGVTILSTSSVDGDALSTACFVLGMDKGMELIQSLPDTEAIFITTDNQIVCTK